MTQSFTQNLKKWLIGLSVIVVIFTLAGYRYSKSHAQDDVLTIGISPPYAELLQSVAVIKPPMKQVVYATNYSLKVTDWPQTTQYSSIDVKARPLILKHSKNKPHKF
jgi:Flp pilus assembly protein CpaB